MSHKSYGEASGTDARRLISLKTAASLVDVDAKTIRNWIAAGQLRGFRINGHLLRVNHAELLALVQPILTSIPEDAA
ncbi:helix-turn-helix domain-containing protein [Nocardia bovistercoris]|uniref:Helix-turn-helix domain-containing protein n=1 Tax=Nocardia bovistercoris TaxID=2785916 RepID=A0A931I9D3_9NOCA|nr:helix-turn-helix domain-containing protein [Nocardia bovistercoris]MBH0777269.1 helix-turn-helix domain-containing protein [Nocardia bovistercoris]